MGTGTGTDLIQLVIIHVPKHLSILDLNAPVFVFTYGESELLLAEAAARGWNVGGTAEVHYANGVAGGLEPTVTYSTARHHSAAAATAYAAAQSAG